MLPRPLSDEIAGDEIALRAPLEIYRVNYGAA